MTITKMTVDEKNDLWPHAQVTDDDEVQIRHRCRACDKSNIMPLVTIAKLVSRGQYHGYCYQCNIKLNIIN